MFYMLGAESNGNGIGMTILLGIMVLLMIVYLIFGTINRKKQQEQALKMMSELQAGDKIVTNAGIYGEIVSMRETNMGRVVVLKTGADDDEKKASYITVNASVILGIDKKEDLILDENGNVIDPSENLKEQILGDVKEEENEDKKASQPKAEGKTLTEKEEKKSVAEKVEEKPAKKVAKKATASKKSTEKAKTSAKSTATAEKKTTTAKKSTKTAKKAE